MKDIKSSFYDKYVSTHIADRKGIPTLEEFKTRSRIYQEHFGDFLPTDKSARILDIGCGNGSIVWWLQQAGYDNAFGIDVSKEQIEVGRGLGVKNILQADLNEYLETNKNAYDMIIARDVIEHFSKEAIMQILSECYNSIKTNGRLMLQVPNAESPFFGRIRYGDFTHEIAFSSSSMHQVMKMVGFQKVACFSSGPTVGGLKSYIRVIVWKIFERLYKFALYLEVGTSPIERIVTQNIISVATKQQ